MLGTLSRPLPKRQIGRLLMVDAAVIVVLLAVPVRRGWNDYAEAKRLLGDQVTARFEYMNRLGKAKLAETERPVRLGEIRGALDILAGEGRHLGSEGPAILEELHTLSSERGLTQIVLDRLPPSIEEGYQIEGYVLNIQGRFERLLRFLHDLRNLKTYFIVERFNVRIAEEHDRNPTLVLELTLRTIVVEELLLDTVIEMAVDTTAAPAGEEEDVPPPPEGLVPDLQGL